MSDGPTEIIVKRVRKTHKRGHGGSWKVAYADFVTAMMAFFLLLWLIQSVPLNKKYDLSGYLNSYSPFNPAGVSTTQPEDPAGADRPIDRSEESRKRNVAQLIGDEIQLRMGSLWKHVLVKTEDGEVRIHVVDKDGAQMFDTGGIEPSVEARKILARVANVLKKTDYRIAVEGHTDAHPVNKAGITNWSLSTMRAVAAREELVRAGLDEKFRFDEVSGYAETRPLIKNDPFHPTNRRISLLLLKYDSISRSGGGVKDAKISGGKSK
jgi:chemotaxis protein MotB